MNMNLTNEKLNELYESMDINKSNVIKKLLTTQRIKNDTFFEKCNLNSDSISNYPESFEELFEELNTIGKIDYSSLDTCFLKALEQLFYLIGNKKFDDEIPVFTYTL